MSPLGEDALYTAYEKNPFYHFFRCGHKVSLSTDNPLQLHSTSEPLLEEYAIATKVRISFVALNSHHIRCGN